MNVFLHLKVDCSEILCVGLSDPRNSILLPDFRYVVWIKCYLHVNTNAEISCLNWGNLPTLSKFWQQIEFYGSEISLNRILAPSS